MKTTLLLLCTAVLVGFTLPSCNTPPPDDQPEPLPPIEGPARTPVREAPAPARPETPEDFRAITPPSSYSR